MPSFNFRPVHLLELNDADSPSIDVQEGHLILTAERDGEQIRITAPLKNVLPQVEATKVRKPHRSPRFIPGGEKRAGELNGMAKLTDAEVREMRLLLADQKLISSFPSKHALYLELAKTYKVHFATVRSIAHNQSWKHVKI